eukprot:FR735853.1.p1 GENE.FR735853.1~~FR735853.1.p1  ORF type:complete len:211 (+),score=26.94 FR735853.1:1-633(+)
MKNAESILEAWYGGEEAGTAIGQVLFGEVAPSGRMPVTTVASLHDLPPYTDFSLSASPGRTHRYMQRRPLVPFGFGLSYAEFTYSNLGVQPSTLSSADTTVNVSALVTHSAGNLVSDEVAQLFGRFEGSGGWSMPLQQLLAFERIRAIEPGQTVPVSFSVAREELALVDTEGQERVLPGTWALWLGGGPPSNEKFGGGGVLVGFLEVPFE